MYSKRLQEPLREDVLVAQLDLTLAEEARMAHCTPLVANARVAVELRAKRVCSNCLFDVTHRPTPRGAPINR